MAINNIDEIYITQAEQYPSAIRRLKRKPISRLAVAAIVILTLLLCSIVGYAGVRLLNWSANISFHDGTKATVYENAFFKNIPENVPIVNEGECMLEMPHAETEKVLGFHILSSSLSDESTVYNYSTALNYSDNSVARVDLWCPDFIVESDSKKVNMLVSMLDTDAEENYVLPFAEGTDAMGGKTYIGTYPMEQLATDVVVYSAYDMPTLLKAVFVCDDVQYTLSAYNYSLEEFLNILLTLK